jgi:hypothetical protein
VSSGGNIDFEAVLAESRRNHSCAVCHSPLAPWQRVTSTFCSPRCRLKFRDARRYAEDPEGQRAKARAYYAENRERVLEKAAAKRGRERPVELKECSECGGPLEGKRRVVCSRRCVDARYRRLHPEAYAERERRKVERRRQKRAER